MATLPSDKSLRLQWIFLCENLRLRNRILSQKHVAKTQIMQNFATYCGDKILLQTHEAICRCNVSPQRVASTSRPTCTHRLICRRDVLLQLVARPVHTEWYVAATCCCNLSPDLYTRTDMWPRLVAATCRLVLCTDLKVENISDRCSYQIAFSVGTNAYTV